MRETCQFTEVKLHFQARILKSLYLGCQFYIPLTKEYGNLSKTIHLIIKSVSNSFTKLRLDPLQVKSLYLNFV